jgi:hypothetical protein
MGKMTARMSSAIYRLHAAHCAEIAAITAVSEDKLKLLNMARAWLLLAEQAEKNRKIVYETACPIQET